ncbi:DUF433 domain-containing protein [Desulfobacterales bacterium HSG2]|nr:DUF433 domain-containing protein [Desulfobacterales bacterium HSG2]
MITEKDRIRLPDKAFDSPGYLLAERLTYALKKMSDSVEINSEIRGGIPVLKGSRMPVSRIIAELGENATISEIAEDYELDVRQVRNFIDGLAVLLDRSVLKK